MDGAFDEVRQMSEPAFRDQLLAWMQTKDVSRRIQSKLRRDMIECFAATTLGREMEMRQHNFGNRQVPTASLLALNTLVAEFLYAQNCQFALSVFASEVPYQGIIPDFESGPINNRFRFSPTEQTNLLHSLGVADNMGELIQKQYQRSKQNLSENASLLFQLLCTVFSTPKLDSKLPANTNSKATQCQSRMHLRKHSRGLYKSSSKGLVRVRTLIENLTNGFLDMTDALVHQSADTSAETIVKMIPVIRKQRHRIGRLKSCIENHKIKLVVDSIYQLSTELERCLGLFKDATFRKQDEQIRQVINEIPITCEKQENANHDIRYGDWVRDLKNSVNGKRFLQHLIEHTRRTRQKFVEAQETEMAQTMKAERARLKLHYKQRFLDRCQGLVMVTSSSAEAACVEDSSHPGLNVGLTPNTSSVLPAKSQRNHIALSNRKLPDIEIRPCVDPNEEVPAGVIENSLESTKNIALQTRQRVEELVAKSEDIEHSIQTRLHQHNLNSKTIFEQQRYIRQRSNLEKQLISGVRITNRSTAIQTVQNEQEGELDDLSQRDETGFQLE